jgi:hypothetical protein
VVMQLLVQFNLLNSYHPLVRQLGAGLRELTWYFYRPFRWVIARLLNRQPKLDISPLLAIMLLKSVPQNSYISFGYVEEIFPYILYLWIFFTMMLFSFKSVFLMMIPQNKIFSFFALFLWVFIGLLIASPFFILGIVHDILFVIYYFIGVALWVFIAKGLLSILAEINLVRRQDQRFVFVDGVINKFLFIFIWPFQWIFCKIFRKKIYEKLFLFLSFSFWFVVKMKCYDNILHIMKYSEKYNLQFTITSPDIIIALYFLIIFLKSFFEKSKKRYLRVLMSSWTLLLCFAFFAVVFERDMYSLDMYFLIYISGLAIYFMLTSFFINSVVPSNYIKQNKYFFYFALKIQEINFLLCKPFESFLYRRFQNPSYVKFAPALAFISLLCVKLVVSAVMVGVAFGSAS